MENYYDDLLAQIEAFIAEGKYLDALVLIDKELQLPFVPQATLDLLVHYQKALEHPEPQKPITFLHIDDLEEALLTRPKLHGKVLMSLEAMNIRPHMDRVKQWLASYDLSDDIKKHILFLLIDQNIEADVFLVLTQKGQAINTMALNNPFASDEYRRLVHELRVRLESEDPSFMQLCLAELSTQVTEVFPQALASISADAIIANVSSYLMNSE